MKLGNPMDESTTDYSGQCPERSGTVQDDGGHT